MARPSISALPLLAAAGLALVAVPAAAQGARDSIRIVGSSTVYPFSTQVAERFARQGGAAPVVESTGTGGGIKLFCSGVGPATPDIANASRAIKDSERQDCAAHGVTDVQEVKIGFDGIVLAEAARDDDPAALTRAQIWTALAKQVPVDGKLVDNPYKQWSDIDPQLPARPILVYGPPPTSGTRDALVELVLDKGCEDVAEIAALDDKARKTACQTVREDGAYVDAGENDNLIIQRLTSDPNAIGIFGYSYLEQNADRLQAHAVEGVAPSYDTIADGTYPVARPLFFYVKTAHLDVIPGLKDYVALFQSDEAIGEDGFLADKGLIALPEDQRADASR